MQRLLFLDFDGVLHADGEEPLARLPLLEQYLLTMPELMVVISSAWRHEYAFDELRWFFSPPFHPRMVGSTPIRQDGLLSGGRRREIEDFLAGEPPCPWVALDDMANLFAPNDPHLIWVNPLTGFTDREGSVLQAWYQTGQLPQSIPV